MNNMEHSMELKHAVLLTLDILNLPQNYQEELNLDLHTTITVSMDLRPDYPTIRLYTSLMKIIKGLNQKV